MEAGQLTWNRNITIKNSQLLRKAMVGYLLIGIIPVIVITVLISIVYINQTNETTNLLADQNAVQHENIVQERLANYNNVMYNLITESDLIRNAALMNGEGDNLVERQEIRELLISYVYTYDEIRGAAFIADNTNYVSYSKWYGSVEELSWSEKRHRRDILEQVRNMQKMTYILVSDLREADTSTDYVILMCLPVRNLYTKERYGVMVIALSNKVLEFASGYNNEERLESVVVDSTDRIITETQNGNDGGSINIQLSEYLHSKYEEGQIALRRHAIDGTGWTIVTVINQHVVHRQIAQVLGTAIVAIVLITIAFFIAVVRYIYHYVQRINGIAYSIAHFEADKKLTTIPNEEDGDELNSIVSGFRKMAEKNTALMAALQRRNHEILKAENDQRHAEIVALESQINPHFLYNTLDSINWRAIDAGEEEISNMLGTLGSLLRYSVSNIDVIVLLRAEIEWTQKYVFLQKDRFHQSFDCEYEVTEEAMDFPVYKMLLQPIIENSIIHAFEDIHEGGMILVQAFVRQDGKLEIHVRDNGKGMNSETLELLRKDILPGEKLNSRSIGISNVASRLHVYYHGEADMKINSDPQLGTEVILLIPYQTMPVDGSPEDEDDRDY